MAECLIEKIISLASSDLGEVQKGACGGTSSPSPPLRVGFEWSSTIDAHRAKYLDSAESRRDAKEYFFRGLRYICDRTSSDTASPLITFVYSLIKEVNLGSTSKRRLLITASSPQALGVVWFAGDWESLSPHRIAANILHEAMHQALYRREYASPEIYRHNSIAYSPWKQTERPGRWVWHAFWTFSLHCAFLASAIDTRSKELEEDAIEIAIMYLRLRQCHNSLLLFDIVRDSKEEDRIRCAAQAVCMRIESGEQRNVWLDQINRHRDSVEHEFKNWAQRTISFNKRVQHR